MSDDLSETVEFAWGCFLLFAVGLCIFCIFCAAVILFKLAFLG